LTSLQSCKIEANNAFNEGKKEQGADVTLTKRQNREIEDRPRQKRCKKKIKKEEQDKINTERRN
jgi:hypothetical protein